MMSRLISITIVAVLLYVLYHIGGRWLFPLWQRKRMERYKKQFFEENPHISPEAYEALQKKQQEESPIIDRRIRKR